MGIPASGPGFSSAAISSSTAAASRNAASASTATKAFTLPFRSSILASAPSVSSRAETSLDRTWAARSATASGRKSTSVRPQLDDVPVGIEQVDRRGVAAGTPTLDGSLEHLERRIVDDGLDVARVHD